MPKIPDYPRVTSLLTGRELIPLDTQVPDNPTTAAATSSTIVQSLQPGTVGTVVGDLGYQNSPISLQFGDYVLQASDAGVTIVLGDDESRAIDATFLIPSDATVDLPLGTVFTFVSLSLGTLTIDIDTDSMFQAGTTTTGPFTMAQNQTGTAVKVDTTTWLITVSLAAPPPPATLWTLTSSATGSYFAVAYGNGLWIAGGAAAGAGPPATLVKSTDGGATWSTFTVDPSVMLACYAIRYLNSQWVLAGVDNGSPAQLVIYTSPDGATWTNRLHDVGGVSGSLPTDVQWNGSNYLVLDQGNSNRWTSPDGHTWSKNLGGGSITLLGGLIDLHGTNFVTMWDLTTSGSANQCQVAQSSNGQPPWNNLASALQVKLNTLAFTPALLGACGLVHLGSTYIMGGGNDSSSNVFVETITNISPWTSSLHQCFATATGESIFGICAGPTVSSGNLFCVGGTNGSVATSGDGLTWSDETSQCPMTNGVNALAAGLDGSGNAIFVAVGFNQIAVRKDL